MAQPQVNPDTLPKFNPYAANITPPNVPLSAQRPAIPPSGTKYVPPNQGAPAFMAPSGQDISSMTGLPAMADRPVAPIELGSMQEISREPAVNPGVLPPTDADWEKALGTNTPATATAQSRNLSTSDAAFNATGRLNAEDMGAINARIRERGMAGGTYTGAGTEAPSAVGTSAPYDPVAQLARLREIDPEKYGAPAGAASQTPDFSIAPGSGVGGLAGYKMQMQKYAIQQGQANRLAEQGIQRQRAETERFTAHTGAANVGGENALRGVQGAEIGQKMTQQAHLLQMQRIAIDPKADPKERELAQTFLHRAGGGTVFKSMPNYGAGGIPMNPTHEQNVITGKVQPIDYTGGASATTPSRPLTDFTK